MSASILSLLDNEILRSVPQRNGTVQPYFEEISSILDPIRLNRGNFMARKQLVGLVGPGRSGKSTLLNAIVGSEISPIGSGFETTSRASIVKYSKEPGIEVYFADKTQNAHTIQEYSDLILPFISLIRGTTKNGKNNEKLRKLECLNLALSSDNLIKALVGQFQKEPVMVIIKTPEWVLKTDQLCFVDFPGLDGLKHNFQNNPSAYALLGLCDFLILNQSNFSSLDKSMVSFVSKMLNSCEKPPVWFVHNKVEAKSWRSEEEFLKELEEMVEASHQMISEELDLDKRDIPINIINLGKAHDGIFSSRENLFHESQFENFETHFMGEIHSIRLQKLMESSSEALERLPKVKSKIEADELEYQNKLKVIKKVESALKALAVDEKSEDFVFDKNGPLEVDKILALLKSLIQSDFDFAVHSMKKLSDKKKDKIPATSVNARLGNLMTQVEETINGFTWSNFTFLAEEYCSVLNDLSSSAESAWIMESNHHLRNIGLKELRLKDSWHSEDLVTIPFGKIDWNPVKKIKKIFGLLPWPKSYSYDFLKDHIEGHLFDKLMEQNVRALDEWREMIRDKFLKKITIERKNAYLRNLSNIHDDLIKESEQIKTRCNESIEVIDFIQSRLQSVHSMAESELSMLKSKKWSSKMLRSK